jgi:hypothetical protein
MNIGTKEKEYYSKPSKGLFDSGDRKMKGIGKM